ncbi:SGNH/GDSL hydrolase family protein [Meridianimarinicoccus aquatilis]|uniref:SGNH/GDSL hydrolase family protein n=1 Tax=Meridianimarinicoccus aquatilis TaxID=2552766 RepID=A0A4R6ASF6_9RHOB|nr:SGNH/GDSL hydrolase family protein [Fluviibacterium aquatile]TDL86414.1 SGNH/GDSL hydrolase family protein [Fluviibacterium aquatile]
MAWGPRAQGLAAGLVLVLGAGLVLRGTGPAPGDRAIPPLASPPATLQIAAFGTSLTARNAWPDGLQAALRACLMQQVQVDRVAGVGQGSQWGLAQVSQVVALRPDIVLIEFTANDADLLDGVSVARSRAQHAQILAELRRDLPEARLVLMTMNPVSGWQRVKRLRLGAYHAMYRKLARDADVGLADLTPRWNVAPQDLRHAPDGLHPTGAATQVVVTPALTGLIGQAMGQSCGPPV